VTDRPIPDPRRFIQEQTRVKPVPHAEEISLHVADEAMELWQKTEDDLGELGLDPPFWAFAWAGGQALARYILDTPSVVAGLSVLDLASGSALVGIAAMKAGAQACTCVDIDPFSRSAGELNAAVNAVSLEFVCADILDGPVPEVDVILAGDVFYDKTMADRFLAYLEQARAAGIEVIVGDPGRNYLPKDRLTQLAVYTVPVVGALEDNALKRTSVFRFNAPN